MGFAIDFKYNYYSGDRWITGDCIGLDDRGQFTVKYEPRFSSSAEPRHLDPENERLELRFPQGIPEPLVRTVNKFSDESREIPDSGDIDFESLTKAELKDLIDQEGLDVKKSQNKQPLIDDISEAMENRGSWSKGNAQVFQEKFEDALAEHLYSSSIQRLAEEWGFQPSVLETILRVRACSPHDYSNYFDEDYEPIYEMTGENIDRVTQDSAASDTEEEISSQGSQQREVQEEDIEETDEEEFLMDVQFIVKKEEGGGTVWYGLDAAGQVVAGPEDTKSGIYSPGENEQIGGTTSIGDGIYYAIPESAEAIGLDLDEVGGES